jgi:hypothetical protein
MLGIACFPNNQFLYHSFICDWFQWIRMKAVWLSLLLLLCRSCLVQSDTGFHYVWLLSCCMEWDRPLVIYFIPQESVCILLKTNFHAFDAFVCYFLFVLLVFHKFLETKIGVLHCKLNLVFVAVLLISVKCECQDYCFCLHHLVIKKKLKLAHQLNYENYKTYFIGFRCSCWFQPSEVRCVRWPRHSIR